MSISEEKLASAIRLLRKRLDEHVADTEDGKWWSVGVMVTPAALRVVLDVLDERAAPKLEGVAEDCLEHVTNLPSGERWCQIHDEPWTDCDCPGPHGAG